MKKITLNNGSVALIDDRNYDLIRPIKWQNVNGYAMSRDVGLMHVLILQPRPGKISDHINRDTLDNQRHNLRECTQPENAKNLSPRKGCASKYKGVTYHKFSGLWKASITSDGKTHSLRYHKTEGLAAAAYDEASRRLHGNFASPNDQTIVEIDFSVPDAIDTYDYMKIQRDLKLSPYPLAMIEFEEHIKQLDIALSKLTFRDREIITLRFNPDDGRVRSFKEIGVIFGITGQRVMQIQTESLNKLKMLLTKRN